MKRRLGVKVLLMIFSVVFFVFSGQLSDAETGKGSQVRRMTVTGEIGKVKHGYVIRTEGPGTIFTVLNSGPELDEYVKSGKTARLDIRIVSGDNVNIEKIDGKDYPQDRKKAQVRQMTVTGELAKVKHGYVIRTEGPGTIFTVLNPDPKLDEYAQNGRTAKFDIRIVSGDNVNIEKIDGKDYP